MLHLIHYTQMGLTGVAETAKFHSHSLWTTQQTCSMKNDNTADYLREKRLRSVRVGLYNWRVRIDSAHWRKKLELLQMTNWCFSLIREMHSSRCLDGREAVQLSRMPIRLETKFALECRAMYLQQGKNTNPNPNFHALTRISQKNICLSFVCSLLLQLVSWFGYEHRTTHFTGPDFATTSGLLTETRFALFDHSFCDKSWMHIVIYAEEKWWRKRWDLLVGRSTGDKDAVRGTVWFQWNVIFLQWLSSEGKTWRHPHSSGLWTSNSFGTEVTPWGLTFLQADFLSLQTCEPQDAYGLQNLPFSDKPRWVFGRDSRLHRCIGTGTWASYCQWNRTLWDKQKLSDLWRSPTWCCSSREWDACNNTQNAIYTCVRLNGMTLAKSTTQENNIVVLKFEEPYPQIIFWGGVGSHTQFLKVCMETICFNDPVQKFGCTTLNLILVFSSSHECVCRCLNLSVEESFSCFRTDFLHSDSSKCKAIFDKLCMVKLISKLRLGSDSGPEEPILHCGI